VTSDNTPLDFDAALSRCVKEGLTEALGSVIVDAIFDQMYEHYDITLGNLPTHLKMFTSVMEGAFGQQVNKVLSRVIARKLYAYLSLEFVENPAKGLLEYVEEMRKKLAKS